MNSDSSINNIRNFERLSEVLAQLGISVRNAAGNFRKVSEVINDLLAINRNLSFSRRIFKDEFLVAEAYDMITSELKISEVGERGYRRYLPGVDYWARSPSTGSESQWFATTRNPYGQKPYRSVNGEDDYLDLWRYMEMDRTSFKPRVTETQTDELNTATQEAINDFLAEFKIVERKAG